MILFDKFNALLGKFVGPNAAHVIDALIGLALVGAGTFAVSAPARAFLDSHALLAVIVSGSVPLVTALASKFRKAAGSSAPLVDQLVAAVTQAVHDAHGATKPVSLTSPDAVPRAPAPPVP